MLPGDISLILDLPVFVETCYHASLRVDSERTSHVEGLMKLEGVLHYSSLKVFENP